MNLPAPTYRVYGDLILCDYAPPDTGKIITPDKYKEKLPPWVIVTAIEVGEKCAFVKKGDRLLVNSNAIYQNIKIPGLPQPYFTKEDKILAVVTLPEIPMIVTDPASPETEGGVPVNAEPPDNIVPIGG